METINLPFSVKKPILACGADLKGAFALAKGSKTIIFDGFGDLSDADNFGRYEKAVKSAIKRFAIKPAIVACDLHPGYFSTRFAEDFCTKRTLRKVQHHEAHVASVMIDRAMKGDTIGIALDGTGLGSDGNIWGSEFFICDRAGFKRVAHLEYAPMPGGEAAVREPWRMAAGYLYKYFGKNFLSLSIDFIKMLDKKRCLLLMQAIDKGINSPLTSGMGRLFDAAGAIILSKGAADFEAQIPIELERMASRLIDSKYEFDTREKDGMFTISPAGIFKGIINDIKNGLDKSAISGKFHNTIAGIIRDTSCVLRKKSGINKVVLTGGVFQNKYLTNRAMELLDDDGFTVYTNQRVSTNDSGIPLGQVAIANMGHVCV